MPSHNPTVQKQNSLFQKKINAREQLSSRNVGQHLKTDRGLFQSRSVGIIPKRFDCGVHPLRPRSSMSSSNISNGPKNDRGTMNSTLRMVTFGTMRQNGGSTGSSKSRGSGFNISQKSSSLRHQLSSALAKNSHFHSQSRQTTRRTPVMRNTARQHNYPTNSDNVSAKIKFQTDMKHQSEASQERHKPSHPSPMHHQPRLASPPMSDTKTESGFAMPKTKSPSP